MYGGARKAAKYAALLALGAMDPVESNRAGAASALQEFVHARRALLGRQGAAAGGGPIHEQPEFVLPYLVQVTAQVPYCSPEL